MMNNRALALAVGLTVLPQMVDAAEGPLAASTPRRPSTPPKRATANGSN